MLSKFSKLAVFVLIASGTIALGGEVSAQTIPGISKVFLKNDLTGEPLNKVILYGTPRTQIPVELSGAATSVSKSFRANGCGHVIITNFDSYSSLRINGASRPISRSLTNNTPIAKPTCAGTVSSQLPVSQDQSDAGVAYSQSWNLGDNTVLIQVPVAINAPNGRSIDATFLDNSSKSRFVSLNECGLGTLINIKNSASIKVNNAAAVTLSDVAAGFGLRCAGDKVLGETTAFNLPALPSAFRDIDNNLYFTGTSGSTISIGLEAQSTSKAIASDRCGGLLVGSQISPQTSAFTIGADTIDPATLAVGLKPNCKKQTDGSYAYDVAPSGNFKTSGGQVFVNTTAAYPNGFGDRRILTITSIGTSSRSLKPNVCGLASVRSSASKPISDTTTFTLGATSYTVSSLPILETSCVNVGTSTTPNFKLFGALN